MVVAVAVEILLEIVESALVVAAVVCVRRRAVYHRRIERGVGERHGAHVVAHTSVDAGGGEPVHAIAVAGRRVEDRAADQQRVEVEQDALEAGEVGFVDARCGHGVEHLGMDVDHHREQGALGGSVVLHELEMLVGLGGCVDTPRGQGERHRVGVCHRVDFGDGGHVGGAGVGRGSGSLAAGHEAERRGQDRCRDEYDEFSFHFTVAKIVFAPGPDVRPGG